MSEERKNNQWFHDILNAGLKTFADYWDFDKIEASRKKTGVLRNQEIYIHGDMTRLKDALSFDESGITAYLLLRAYLYRLLHSVSFTAYDLVCNWEKESAYLKEFAKMRADLEKPEALEIIEEYKGQLREMASAYEVKKTEGFERVISSPIDLGFLRFSAFTSFEKKLKSYQFIQGAGSPAKPKIHRKIFEFWNINSLVQAAATQAFDGAALCLIRDPFFFASFFVFAIKSGETLTILTDRKKGAHPRYNQMSRRPDRDFDSRAGENWFPYQLLEVEVSEDGKRLFEKRRDDLVPINTQLFAVGDIGELEPEQTVWLGVILDLIAKRFGGEKPLQLPSLAYTADMIRKPDLLVGASGALVEQGKYKFLDLPPIKTEDLSADKVVERANFSKETYGINRHIVERFKDQVPEGLFNVVGESEVRQLRAAGDAEVRALKKKNFSSDADEYSLEIRNFSATDFGTPEELDKDRYWNARFNQIEYIDMLARKEFNETSAEVCRWFDARVRANEKALLYAVAAMELNVESGLWLSNLWNDPERSSFPHKDRIKIKIENILKIWTWKGARSGLWTYTHDDGSVLFGGYDPERKPFYFCVSGDAWREESAENREKRLNASRWEARKLTPYFSTAANVAAVFEPTEASHLAILAGCQVEDLPYQLQNWTLGEPYVGNSILDRIDPEDWHLEDYFRKIKFPVIFTLSKSYFNSLRKDYGFPRVDWAKYLKEPRY